MKAFLVIILIFLSNTVCADIPVSSYTYDSEGRAEYSPAPYSVEAVIYPESDDSRYSDFFIFDNTLYILDGGTGTIRTSDGSEMALFGSDGKPYQITDASGLFITDDAVYVADKDGGKIAVFDRSDMRLIMEIADPDTSSIGVDMPFRPASVIADRAGNIYALVPDLYYGALMFSRDGSFLGYYGANPTELSLAERLDQTWKRLLSREQREAMMRFVPVAYTGFDIDSEDFVYTCSFGIENEAMKIRKINPSGTGIWDDKGLWFGDRIPDDEQVDGLERSSHFVDVDISDSFLSALDTGRGRVFIYGSDGTLIAVIGGKGTQKGVFTDPQRIESDGERIYVLDASDSSITVFRKTHYGRALFDAFSLYSDGRYEEALPYWEEVLRLNPSLELAHLGLGKAYEKEGDAAAALSEMRLSGSRTRYSEAFDTLRLEWAREHLSIIFWIIAIVAAVMAVLKKKTGISLSIPDCVRRAFRPLFHPSDEIWEMKREKRFSIIFSTCLVSAYSLLSIAEYFATGYAFNTNVREDFSILMSLMSTVGIYMLFVTVNWGVSTISDGKGTYMEIYAASSYALIPLIGAGIINLIFSHVLTLDEGVFMTWIEAAAALWSLSVLLVSSASIHEYTAGKMLWTFILILLGMAFIIFLIFLFVILVENTVNIASIIFNEIALRR